MGHCVFVLMPVIKRLSADSAKCGAVKWDMTRTGIRWSNLLGATTSEQGQTILEWTTLLRIHVSQVGVGCSGPIGRCESNMNVILELFNRRIWMCLGQCRSHFAFVYMKPMISCTPDCPLTPFLERANELFRNSGHAINFLTSQLRSCISKQHYDDTYEGLISRTIYRDWNLLNHWQCVCKCAAGHLSAYVKINGNEMTNIQRIAA